MQSDKVTDIANRVVDAVVLHSNSDSVQALRSSIYGNIVNKGKDTLNKALLSGDKKAIFGGRSDEEAVQNAAIMTLSNTKVSDKLMLALEYAAAQTVMGHNATAAVEKKLESKLEELRRNGKSEDDIKHYRKSVEQHFSNSNNLREFFRQIGPEIGEKILIQGGFKRDTKYDYITAIERASYNNLDDAFLKGINKFMRQGEGQMNLLKAEVNNGILTTFAKKVVGNLMNPDEHTSRAELLNSVMNATGQTNKIRLRAGEFVDHSGVEIAGITKHETHKLVIGKMNGKHDDRTYEHESLHGALHVSNTVNGEHDQSTSMSYALSKGNKGAKELYDNTIRHTSNAFCTLLESSGIRTNVSDDGKPSILERLWNWVKGNKSEKYNRAGIQEIVPTLNKEEANILQEFIKNDPKCNALQKQSLAAAIVYAVCYSDDFENRMNEHWSKQKHPKGVKTLYTRFENFDEFYKRKFGKIEDAMHGNDGLNGKLFRGYAHLVIESVYDKSEHVEEGLCRARELTLNIPGMIKDVDKLNISSLAKKEIKDSLGKVAAEDKKFYLESGFLAKISDKVITNAVNIANGKILQSPQSKSVGDTLKRNSVTVGKLEKRPGVVPTALSTNSRAFGRS